MASMDLLEMTSDRNLGLVGLSKGHANASKDVCPPERSRIPAAATTRSSREKARIWTQDQEGQQNSFSSTSTAITVDVLGIENRNRKSIGRHVDLT